MLSFCISASSGTEVRPGRPPRPPTARSWGGARPFAAAFAWGWIAVIALSGCENGSAASQCGVEGASPCPAVEEDSCASCDASEVCLKGECVCQPACEGAACGAPDGCGGTCACPSAQCEGAKPATCASTGARCGEVCGEQCGRCAEGQQCISGSCRTGVSCESCELPLSLVEVEPAGGGGRRITLAVDLALGAERPAPRMADLRLRVEGSAVLVSAEAGQAALSASKSLYLDRTTGQKFRRRDDGSYQFLIYGLDSTSRIRAGRLLTLVFTSHAAPLSFALTRRDQTFAPPDADHALAATNYHAPLVLDAAALGAGPSGAAAANLPKAGGAR